jgi:plastocyanin
MKGLRAHSVRRNLAIGLGALMVSAPGLACGGGDSGTQPGQPPAAPGAVEVGDFFFSPQTKRVSVGQLVTWTNTGKQLHTVKGRGFASQAFGNGESYRFRFRRPGTYAYLCTLHPTLMKGTIVVG